MMFTGWHACALFQIAEGTACSVVLQVIYPSTYEGQVAVATVRALAAMQHQQQQHAGNA